MFNIIINIMFTLKHRKSIETDCSLSSSSPGARNWLLDAGFSCSSHTEEDQDQKVDHYSLIFSWFEEHKIKPGDPETINEAFTNHQREHIRVGSSSGVSLSSSSLLARRNRVVSWI